MIINEIELINVRSHKKSFLSFSNGITIINGKTGSGKSSILMGIDYALFGSVGISKGKIMRRGSKSMVISLSFTHNLNKYKIVRGLKRNNNGVISVDINNLKIFKNNKLLNIPARTNDINMEIKKILSIPDSMKARDLFDVTCYSRQDEIRNLINMTKESRQVFIDKILQLDKYKNSFINLKNVKDFFENKIVSLNNISSILDDEKNVLDSKVKELTILDKKIKEYEVKKNVLEKSYNIVIKSKNKVLKEFNQLNNKINEVKENNFRFNSLKKQLSDLINVKEGIVKDIKDEEGKINNVIKDNLNDVNTKIMALSNQISILNNDNKRLKKELVEVNSLSGKCPLCKQDINLKHKEVLNKKYNDKIEFNNNKIKLLNDKLNILKDKKNKCQDRDKHRSKIDSFKLLLLNKQKEEESIKSKLKDLKLLDISRFNKEFELISKKKEDIVNKEKESYSKLNSVNVVLKEWVRNNSNLKKDIESISKKIKEYEIKLNEKVKYLNILKFIKNLRDYVKDIRVVIRQKFLSDFINEFSKKFEEIRNSEENYLVEINNEYEPICYSNNGEKVPISHLSGGEKTSVALAYRLALSDLAATISNILPPELLILDEPTTGFDDEDVKNLLTTLSNIKSIPQIIIVSHNSILKNIGNNYINVNKVDNETIIMD